MSVNRIITKSSDIRVWTIKNEANPNNIPAYQGLMKFTDPSQSIGDVTKIEIADPARPGHFIEIDEIQGAEERVSFGLMGRYPRDVVSTLKLFAEEKCTNDVQAHLGRCRDPLDFNGGWEKIIFFETGKITNYAIENFGAFESGDNAATNETGDWSGGRWYERVRLNFAERATVDVTLEIVSIDVCDTAECGDCDSPSDGCSKVFAVMLPSGSTPGTSPTLVFTDDGYATSSTTTIDSLLGNENPSDSECVGANFVVVSNTDVSLHFADIDEILAGTETWTQVITGFVVAGAPNAIVSVSSRATWIVGDAGYVYFTADPVTGVTVQDAGIATSQNLADVDAFDSDNVVAVGASNAVVVSTNASDPNAIWISVTGPSVGVNLTAIAMRTKDIWVIGNASGEIWYTIDSGVNWNQIELPVTATNIQDIKFATNSVGVISADIAGPAGRLLGTIDGGNSWYVLPEGTGTIPANDQINQVAVCKGAAPSIAANVIYAGGLADDAADGIILKLS